jgi:hypothetical protein
MGGAAAKSPDERDGEISVTDTRVPNDNRSQISRSIFALLGLSMLFALGMISGLLLVKNPNWFPPVAHFLGLGDVYPTQGLIGPQKTIPFRAPAGLGG